MATQASVRELFIDMAIIIAATVVIRNVMGLPFVRGVVSREVGPVGQGAVALAVGAAVDRRREALRWFSLELRWFSLMQHRASLV